MSDKETLSSDDVQRIIRGLLVPRDFLDDVVNAVIPFTVIHYKGRLRRKFGERLVRELYTALIQGSATYEFNGGLYCEPEFVAYSFEELTQSPNAYELERLAVSGLLKQGKQLSDSPVGMWTWYQFMLTPKGSILLQKHFPDLFRRYAPKTVWA